MKKLICLFLTITVISFCFTGCATTGGDRQQTQQEATAVGAGVGALLGALVGAAIGNDSMGVAIGAAVGGIGGAIAGQAYGTHIANEKEKFASEEEWLNECIASAEKINKETRLYNQALASEITDLDNQCAQLSEKYKHKSVTKQSMSTKKGQIDAKKTEVEEKIKRVQFEVENQEKVLADANKKGKTGYAETLNEKISALNQQIKELESHTEALASLSQRMAV
jgi:hypothetical protein